jgi:hypothetical protein
MGHIKEPKGVDFFIKSEPLTEQARKEISEFIQNYAKKNRSKTSSQNSRLKKQATCSLS